MKKWSTPKYKKLTRVERAGLKELPVWANFLSKRKTMANKTKFEVHFLTTTQVARRCGVSRFTVLKWIKQGRINAIKLFGGHYRIPVSEVGYLIETLSQDYPRHN